MKTYCPKFVLLLTMFLVITFTSFGRVNVYDNTNKDSLYYSVIQFTCNELNIDSINIIISQGTFDERLSYINKGLAGLRRYNGNTFMINVFKSNKSDVSRTLIHEIYHIKQMLDDRLKVFSKSVWFEGVTYTNENSSYETRLYEKEAEQISKELWKKYKINKINSNNEN